MAVIPVKRKSVAPLWMWLIGLLVLIALLWFWFGRDGPDRVVGMSGTAPVVASVNAPAGGATASSTASTPVESANPGASAAAPSGAATDPSVYASTVDKLSLDGRDVAFTGVKVIRIVGPRTFTIASGSDELFVIIDPDLNIGVGSQGRIDPGNSVDIKGTFERLQQDEINAMSSSRFRELTELERETLKKTQVYLRATGFSKLG